MFKMMDISSKFFCTDNKPSVKSIFEHHWGEKTHKIKQSRNFATNTTNNEAKNQNFTNALQQFSFKFSIIVHFHMVNDPFTAIATII